MRDQFFKSLRMSWKSTSNVLPLDRVERAACIRSNAVNDFFGGWELGDIDLLSKYHYVFDADPPDGVIVDWLGLKTYAKYHSWLGGSGKGFVVSGLPVPDDTIHAEAIEYIAMLIALERAAEHGFGQFTVLELGASYAPWATCAAVIAKRLKFERVNCVAVEASSGAIKRISEHAELNGVGRGDGVDFSVLHAAVYLTDDLLYFPVLDTCVDNGAQVVESQGLADYRGLSVQYEGVQGVTLEKLCEGFDRVDFLHMDLQGVEQKLLSDEFFVNCLSEKVATLFLATQSRLIEGIALEVLPRHGWRLVRERPTTYKQNNNTSDVNGWTLRDGAQVWLNPRFGSLHLHG